MRRPIQGIAAGQGNLARLGIEQPRGQLARLLGVGTRGHARLHRPVFGFAPQVGLDGIERGRRRQRCAGMVEVDGGARAGRGGA